MMKPFTITGRHIWQSPGRKIMVDRGGEWFSTGCFVVRSAYVKNYELLFDEKAAVEKFRNWDANWKRFKDGDPERTIERILTASVKDHPFTDVVAWYLLPWYHDSAHDDKFRNADLTAFYECSKEYDGIRPIARFWHEYIRMMGNPGHLYGRSPDGAFATHTKPELTDAVVMSFRSATIPPIATALFPQTLSAPRRLVNRTALANRPWNPTEAITGSNEKAQQEIPTLRPQRRIVLNEPEPGPRQPEDTGSLFE